MTKKALYVFCISLCAIFLSSCDSGSSPDPDLLPPGYSVEAIKEGFLETLNYKRVMDLDYRITDCVVDGQEIDVEIRLYEPDLVCVKTDLRDWLALFELRYDTVVCDGLAQPGQYGWPELEKYAVIDRSKVTVKPEHKPNFGQSDLKNKMLEIANEYVFWKVCDFTLAKDIPPTKTYLDADIYIADFYEYERATAVIFHLTNGDFIIDPLMFEIKDSTISGLGLKPTIFDTAFQLTHSLPVYLEKSMEYALEHYVIDSEYLQKAQEYAAEFGPFAFSGERVID